MQTQADTPKTKALLLGVHRVRDGVPQQKVQKSKLGNSSQGNVASLEAGKRRNSQTRRKTPNLSPSSILQVRQEPMSQRQGPAGSISKSVADELIGDRCGRRWNLREPAPSTGRVKDKFHTQNRASKPNPDFLFVKSTDGSRSTCVYYYI